MAYKSAPTVPGCILAIIALPVGAMLSGYVLSVLWGWFIVPVFHLPQIGIVTGSGISIVVNMLIHSATPEREYDEWWHPLVPLFSSPLFALFFGWIWKCFL